MNKVDPITRFTDAENKLINTLNGKKWSKAEALAELKLLLQTAVEIELATIPIYLFTYYSINRTAFSGENMRESDIFANKAGGMIMSVAVEEMLHMSLSANILYSLGEMPKLYGLAPKKYPARLPAHHKTGPKQPKGPDGSRDVKIPLGPMGYEQMWHFLQIEYPETVDAIPQDKDWETIGQVYSYVRCLIASNWIDDGDFEKGPMPHQIQSFNYSPNNTDTVHTHGKFDPWKAAPDEVHKYDPGEKHPSAAAAAVYSNEEDSHSGPTQLLTVNCKRDAYYAIDTICEQGEGYAQPDLPDLPTDDPSKSELSHYYKFLTIQAQFEEYKEHWSAGVIQDECLPEYPKPPTPVSPTVTQKELGEILFEYPPNPVTAEYPKDLKPISDFCNGVFQYMLILTETLYLVPPSQQRIFFNEGMHRSMIWVLDKLIKTMRDITVSEGKYQGMSFGPTFENIDLGPRENSFAALAALGAKATVAADALTRAHPGEAHPAQNVIYYIDQALSATDAQGVPRHLPDVRAYWNGNDPVAS